MDLRKGFTLIELIVVVAIIGILVTIAVPRFTSMTDGANKATFEANHRTIVEAITMYDAKYGHYPPEADDINEFLVTTMDEIEGVPVDATYVYTAGTGKLVSTYKDDTQTFDPTFTP